MKKIIIAGGNGFLGRAFIDYYRKENTGEIIVLSRNAPSNHGNIQYLHWDGETLGDWANSLEGASVLINLAGRTVNCRYTKKNKQEIFDSRLKSTFILGEAVKHCKNPPELWINMSTATIYRDEYEAKNTEVNGKIGEGFSVDVAKQWEYTFFNVETPETRKVAIRTSIAFGKNGDVFKIYNQHVKMYISGKHGHGRQWVSWIHEEDFYRAIKFIIDNDELDGVVNLASPEAIQDKDMMKLFRKIMGYRIGIPIRKWMLSIGAIFLRTETELILKSRWVYPEKLLSHGFAFKFPSMESGLAELFSRK